MQGAPARSVRVGTLEVAYADSGRGTPAVLLHSGGLSSRQWQRLADTLSARHRVLVPDFIGYGRSSPWPRNQEFHFLLDLLAVEALLDTLPEPAHLVGHSYGGFIALLAALHRRAKVRSLALFEPVAFGILHSVEDAAARASFAGAGIERVLLAREGGGGEPWLHAFVDYWGGRGAWDALPESARASFRAVGWKLSGEVRSLLGDRTPPQAYATLEVGTLLLTAESSPLAARRVVAHLAAAIPRARAETVAGAGHMAPVTHAEEVNRRIVDHVARAEGAREA